MTTIEQLNKEISDLQKDIKTIDNEIENIKYLQTQNIQYRDSISKLDREIEILNRQINLLRAENKKQDEVLQELEIQQNDYESLKENIGKFNQKYNEWTGLNDDEKSNWIKKIEKEINEYKNQKVAVIKKIDKLKNQ